MFLFPCILLNPLGNLITDDTLQIFAHSLMVNPRSMQTQENIAMTSPFLTTSDYFRTCQKPYAADGKIREGWVQESPQVLCEMTCLKPKLCWMNINTFILRFCFLLNGCVNLPRPPIPFRIVTSFARSRESRRSTKFPAPRVAECCTMQSPGSHPFQIHCAVCSIHFYRTP